MEYTKENNMRLTKKTNKQYLATLSLLITGILSFSAHAINYTYDQIGRLTHVSYANGDSLAYSYDAAGNLLSLTSSGSSIDTDGDGTIDSIDTDDDNDGLPDTWEVLYGFNPLIADANQDSDSDGYSNLQEYEAGTDPTNNNSVPSELGFALGSYTVNETDGTIGIPVTRTGSMAGAVSITCATVTSGGTAVDGLDYTNVALVLNWADQDDSTKYCNVPILLDSTSEPDETFVVVLYTRSIPEITGALSGNISSTEITITESVQGTQDDFGGNGKADILIRNASGYISLLQMNGSSIDSATGVTGLSIEDWAIAGIADFNNDQKSDILIRNADSGYISLYQMNGANILSLEGVVDLSPDNWAIVGTADFNGDGNADILIRHTSSGYLSLIQMYGSSVTSIAGIMGLDPAAWSIEGLGDFGGDGKADILIRRIGTGYLSLIQMDGSTILSIQGIDNLDPDWAIAGIADFGGDGRADILIRNSGGYMSLLQMNGATIDSIKGIDGLPLAWVIQSTGDQTGDGKADILIRNGSGYISLIEMNGSSINSITGIDHLHPDWVIQNQAAHINTP